MDADTTTGKGGHERALAQFEGLDSGVLLGTQMIAKGLDYPEVTLVGVINADTTLHLPDFRAGERTYQLLEQVAGRAGRGERQGLVIVQTYWPDHPAIQAAARHEPSVFYEDEQDTRRELGYPPFGRLANILFWGADKAAVATAANAWTTALSSEIPDTWSVLGPSPAPISRLKGVWRWHLLVKAPVGARLSEVLSAVERGVSGNRAVSHAIDVDPIDLL
jgi:primosomal protein N' (replication factor Y)